MGTYSGLTTEQREAYWRDGYVVVEDVLDAELLDTLRTSLDERLLPRARADAAANEDFQVEKGSTTGSVRVIWNPARYDDVWWRLMLHPTLVAIYRSLPDLAQLCERLVDLDEGIQEWRYRHVKMVERTIGTKSGTGGSAGAAYLRTTLFKPLFPDLWAIRAEL